MGNLSNGKNAIILSKARFQALANFVETYCKGSHLAREYIFQSI
jgi:hypothetical protein